jgi:hypothetical protein
MSGALVEVSEHGFVYEPCRFVVGLSGCLLKAGAMTALTPLAITADDSM